MAELKFEDVLPQLRRGDIFANLPFVRLSGSDAMGELAPELSKTKRMALLLNQSCDIDKPTTKRLVLLPLVPLSELGRDHQSLIKKNRLLGFLHIPAYRDVFADSFVMFTEPMTVDRTIVEKTPRVASLSPELRRALLVGHTRYVTRWMFNSITCINCGANFDPSQTLPVVND